MKLDLTLGICIPALIVLIYIVSVIIWKAMRSRDKRVKRDLSNPDDVIPERPQEIIHLRLKDSVPDCQINENQFIGEKKGSALDESQDQDIENGRKKAREVNFYDEAKEEQMTTAEASNTIDDQYNTIVRVNQDHDTDLIEDGQENYAILNRDTSKKYHTVQTKRRTQQDMLNGSQQAAAVSRAQLKLDLKQVVMEEQYSTINRDGRDEEVQGREILETGQENYAVLRREVSTKLQQKKDRVKEEEDDEECLYDDITEFKGRTESPAARGPILQHKKSMDPNTNQIAQLSMIMLRTHNQTPANNQYSTNLEVSGSLNRHLHPEGNFPESPRNKRYSTNLEINDPEDPEALYTTVNKTLKNKIAEIRQDPYEVPDDLTINRSGRAGIVQELGSGEEDLYELPNELR